MNALSNRKTVDEALAETELMENECRMVAGILYDLQAADAAGGPVNAFLDELAPVQMYSENSALREIITAVISEYGGGR